MEASQFACYAVGRDSDVQLPITPPSSRVMATTDGRGGVLLRKSKSGQRVEGLSKVESLYSPGCCTATNSVLLSGVKAGPHISASFGQA